VFFSFKVFFVVFCFIARIVRAESATLNQISSFPIPYTHVVQYQKMRLSFPTRPVSRPFPLRSQDRHGICYISHHPSHPAHFMWIIAPYNSPFPETKAETKSGQNADGHPHDVEHPIVHIEKYLKDQGDTEVYSTRSAGGNYTVDFLSKQEVTEVRGRAFLHQQHIHIVAMRTTRNAGLYMNTEFDQWISSLQM